MNIVLISSSKGKGGREMVVPILARELIERGHNVEIIAQKDSWIDIEAHKLDFPVHSFKIRNYFDPLALIKIGLLLRRIKADVVHIHFITDIWHVVPAVKLFCPKCRIVLSRHMFSAKMKDLARTLLFNGISHIAAVSNKVLKDFVSKTRNQERKISVVYPGVCIEDFQKEYGNTSFRKELGISRDAIIIGFVGRIDPGKGIDTLVDAAPKVIEACPDVVFLIVGKPTIGEGLAYDNLVKERLKEQDIEKSFVFSGFRPEPIERIMSSFDIFVCPSHMESFGIVVIEAMAAGKPVVGFDRGALPEIIVNNLTGKIVPFTSHDFAVGLIDLVCNENKRKIYGLAARERVRTHFSLNKTVDEYENIYRKLVINIL